MIMAGNDPVIARRKEEAEVAFDDRARRESSPVTATIDLSLFTIYDASCQTYGRRGDMTITVDKRGVVNISHEIGKVFSAEKAELRMNKRGTMLAVLASPRGIPVRSSGNGKSMAKRVNCQRLKDDLLSLGVELPVKFVTEWNEQLQAWIGKR